MGAKTTMAELAAFWQEMTAEERLDYRVRFGDDVLEVISIDVQGDEAHVRGYQLNGAIADSQRDENSRVARVRVFPIRLGGVEILDRDEPVDNDDPGPPPPVLRLAENGEYERVDGADMLLPGPTQPSEPGVEMPIHAVASPPPSTFQPMFERPERTAWDHAEDIGPVGYDPEKLRQELRSIRPERESALGIPVDEWANSAMRLPHPLLERLTKAAKQRAIGRNILLAHLLEPALDALESRPPV